MQMFSNQMLESTNHWSAGCRNKFEPRPEIRPHKNAVKSYRSYYFNSKFTKQLKVLTILSICRITEEVNAIQELRLLIGSELDRMKRLLAERRDMLLSGATSDPVGSAVSQRVSLPAVDLENPLNT